MKFRKDLRFVVIVNFGILADLIKQENAKSVDVQLGQRFAWELNDALSVNGNRI